MVWQVFSTPSVAILSEQDHMVESITNGRISTIVCSAAIPPLGEGWDEVYLNRLTNRI
ncbi:hypothetical protein EP837_03928 (plasmid) [Sphingobium sp. EP60837]|nr:hypothetical protein EP837_03928 [Sphingobium sp. EP60837]